MWLLLIVLLLITILASSPEIHYTDKQESLYYYIPIDRNEPNEHHSHSPEEEMVSVFEIAGTFYGEAIGEDWIYPDEFIGGELV